VLAKASLTGIYTLNPHIDPAHQFGSRLTSSTYRDLTEQARVEADTILGDLIERGRKHGISAPIVQAAFANLTIYQQGRVCAKAVGR
jgi:2-dehydropantoate 2-reductase